MGLNAFKSFCISVLVKIDQSGLCFFNFPVCHFLCVVIVQWELNTSAQIFIFAMCFLNLQQICSNWNDFFFFSSAGHFFKTPDRPGCQKYQTAKTLTWENPLQLIVLDNLNPWAFILALWEWIFVWLSLIHCLGVLTVDSVNIYSYSEIFRFTFNMWDLIRCDLLELTLPSSRVSSVSSSIQSKL